MVTAIQHLAGLVVGTVECVTPAEIQILLELDAPTATAFNTGSPTSFPRLNSYVLLPNEAGATVAYVSWMGIERSPYPKRSGLKDFGLIDLPFPLRKINVVPVGTLRTRRDQTQGGPCYELQRGVLAFPSIGDQVLLPTESQIEAIVGANRVDRRVRIGTSPLALNAPILVDPNKLFGRHLAILGNTGSGKSCSVAGLIRWSINASKKESKSQGFDHPNARFIVLDPNGEYARAFADFGDGVRLFKVPPSYGGERPLNVPSWLWNGHEWSAVAQAQPGAQRPLLLQGLRDLKSGNMKPASREAAIRNYLSAWAIQVASMLSRGPSAFAGSAKPRFDCARLLRSIADETNVLANDVDSLLKLALQKVSRAIYELCDQRKARNSDIYFDDFLATDLERVNSLLEEIIVTLPKIDIGSPVTEDAPLPFDVHQLADHLERLAMDQGGALAGFISTLGMRIRGMLADQRLGSVIGRNPPIAFSQWLDDYIGADNAHNGPIAIIDLSLVPTEIVHVIVAVLGRLIFETLQRYRRSNESGNVLPTTIVLEEAHNFIKRGSGENVQIGLADQLCRETFEKIAREGRKFGLGLVLSSQRPSELSPTALAQCNTFLLHRIVNDSDQALVSKLVPDNVGGLLKELPSLPSRQAILLGWATPIPVLVDMDELPTEHQPHSADPDYWEVWTRERSRPVDWDSIANEWTRRFEDT